MSNQQQLIDVLNVTQCKPIPPIEINPSELSDEYGSFGISRIPPMICLEIDGARQSIRDGIRGLLKNDKHGIPAGEVITSDRADFARLEKLHTTIVRKAKLQKGYKARLCLRGDQQSLINSGFVSPPTASRGFLRWVVILKVNNSDFDMGLVDISQAFLQSSYLHKSERVIAIVPPYVKFHQ